MKLQEKVFCMQRAKLFTIVLLKWRISNWKVKDDLSVYLIIQLSNSCAQFAQIIVFFLLCIRLAELVELGEFN